MTDPIPPISPMIASLEKLIELTREQATTLREAHHLGRRRQEDDEEEASSPSHTLDDLELFIGRLRQIKEWLIQDPEMLRLVDTHLSQHVQGMEKRQTTQNIWLAVITTIAGAILGWLISALASPMTLWHLLFH
jgi:hypothetical protein